MEPLGTAPETSCRNQSELDISELDIERTLMCIRRTFKYFALNP